MSLDSMKEIFDRMEAEHKPFWEIVLDEDGNQIELKEDENAPDSFNLARMDAEDDRRNRYADESELADAGFDYVPEEEVEASYDGADDEF